MKFSLIAITALAAKVNADGHCGGFSETMEQVFYQGDYPAYPVGAITALIPEAQDAAQSGITPMDGESGDVDFPFGSIKALATVGEFSTCNDSGGELVVGVPDGLGAYLVEDDVVRVIVQSESYGQLRRESYPFIVNGGAASFTGSHVQYVDYDRDALGEFMEHDGPASDMVVGMGNLIKHFYNLKGELVGPRNPNGPTTYGAHYSNTDAAGNYVVDGLPSRADWLLQSLCSAHMEVAEGWGPGIGFADDIFLTNEEWMTYEDDVEAFVGLSVHAIDVDTKTAYAVGSTTMGGFEKVVEVNPMHEDYVVIAISGYNGAFGSYDKVIEKRNAAYTRPDGNPYVKPQNTHPARIYVGIKGKMEDGSQASSDDFLARNGLRYGQVYGFAIDMSENGPTGGVWRDEFHKSSMNGAKVDGVFTKVDWMWDGTVKDFEHDGSWGFQEQPPMHLGSDNYFWNAKGNDESGCKTEHHSPDPREGKSGFIQSSTCGYFGHYYLNDIYEKLVEADGNLPGDISSTYYVYQGETDITGQIELGGKGKYSQDGTDATKNYDKWDAPKVTFEDIDGFEILEGPDEELFAVIQEDSGNDFGERMFITEALQHDGEDITYYFVAMSGGQNNTRHFSGVGIPAGVNGGASSHEFSGIADLSGLVHGGKSGGKGAKGENTKAKGGKVRRGARKLSKSSYGYEKRESDRQVAINDKLILLGLQAHNYYDGIIASFQGDRGGQWLAYQPDIPGY